MKVATPDTDLSPRRKSQIRRLLFYVSVLTLALPVSIQGQAPGEPVPEPPVSAPLDAPIDRTRYVLGPGDVLTLSMLGEVTRLHQVPIAPDGSVLIPDVGVVDVLGLTLQDAEAKIRRRVLTHYRNIEVHVALSQIRAFKVFVVGNVLRPGMRLASPVTRVSEVIGPVNGAEDAPAGSVIDVDEIGQPTDTTGITTGRRNILIQRLSGDTIYADLIRFFQLGDLAANPTVRDGDVIRVPVTDEVVRVFGAVFHPAVYEFKPGETLTELLELANGGNGFPTLAGDTVKVLSNPGGTSSIRAMSRSEATGAPGRSLLLQPFDVVYVSMRPDVDRLRSATVTGRVERPGSYPIVPGQTTVRDLVSMAGGFLPDASLTNARLQRATAATVARLEALRALPPELLTSVEQRLLSAREASSGAEREVVVDFQALFVEGVDAYDQPLQSGDSLHVPKLRHEITVLGAVVRPGLVQFSPELSFFDFIRLAGGFTTNADRGESVVVTANSGSRRGATDVPNFKPGDTIIVPYREPRSFLQVLQTASTVVTTITTVVLTILAIDR